MGILFNTITNDLIAILVVVILYVYYSLRQSYNHWKRKGLPFLTPVFPFGNYKEVFMQRKSFGENCIDIYNASDEPVVGIWAGLRPSILVRDPEISRQILISDFKTFPDRGFFFDEVNDPISGHLFQLRGEKWRRMRAILSPAFTSGKIKAMFSSIVGCSESLDNFVDNAATTGKPIEARELMAEFTTNVIASVAFGIDIDCIKDPNNVFRHFGRKIFELSFKNALRTAITFIFPKLIEVSGTKMLDGDVESFIVGQVRANMEFRETNNVVRHDFFQLLLQLRNTGSVQEHDNFAETKINAIKSLSIMECAAQSFVFFAAGFETSSTTMALVLYELARNPDCLRRAQEDIDEVLARHNGKLTYDSIAEIKYLDLCFDETLRMHPSVPFINRQCVAPWKIPNTNVIIDKDTTVIIPAIGMQNDPKYFPNPEQFIPERFSPEQSAGHTFLDRPYLAFGEGPHNCIGLRQGKLQSKIGLITMIRKYNYELHGVTKGPIKMSPMAFLWVPVGGVNLKVTHRKRGPTNI